MGNLSDNKQKILNALGQKPGQKAVEIASQLGLEKKTVNSLLYGVLKSKVRQDNRYRWYLKAGRSTLSNKATILPEKKTPLAKLCKYYLECLSRDELQGVSVFADSKFELEYVEIQRLPLTDEERKNIFNSYEGKEALGKIKDFKSRKRKILFLGYPVRLRFHKTAKWEGFFVEPVFIFPFSEAENHFGTPTLENDMPEINFKMLQSILGTKDYSVLEHAISLMEELGIAGIEEEFPEFEDLMLRLHEIRPDWDWKEEPNVENLTSGVKLSEIKDAGIYNRAVLVVSERSVYTKGLETELSALQKLDEVDYIDTALGSWITNRQMRSNISNRVPLLEVLPLNNEQRQAVTHALHNPITVITGPPGTGKSQVVTSILINAAIQGKTVLFASKNNKAVDVVETRVNSLGARPILLRLGSSEFQSKLAEYLNSLLASTTTPYDQTKFHELNEVHANYQRKIAQIEEEIDRLIQLRNEIDHLDQQLESVRKSLGEERIGVLKNIKKDQIEKLLVGLFKTIDYIDVKKQPFFKRFLWKYFYKKQLELLREEIPNFKKATKMVNISVPEFDFSRASIERWIKFREELKESFSFLPTFFSYNNKLDVLNNSETIEQLTKRQMEITREIADGSIALWQVWLRLQPARISSEQRKLLGDYCSVLELIVEANNEDRRVGKEVFRKYYQLFPKITSLLSCWAVTSLSVRSRVPFESNFFDLLVIDEASQCDIASALPLLYRSQNVTIIGDPKQLRHISKLTKAQDQQLLSKHKLLDDFPGWAFSTRSLFDLASSLCHSNDIVTLRDHHRSHAEIIEFSNNVFYENRLRIATRYDRLKRPSIDEPAVRWINVDGKATRPGSGGAINKEEAYSVVDEVVRLGLQGYKGNIGIVSPFRAQANFIRDLISTNNDLKTKVDSMDLLVDTVHKFQGDERDVIIFSPVVSGGTSKGSIHFLRRTPNLFNVAITRARAALIVVGNKTFAKQCDVEYLSKFAHYVDAISDAPQELEEFGDKINMGAEYPVVSNPGQVSDWERCFYKALYNENIHAIVQHRVDKYILDFAIIIGKRRLNIEIDGEHYHRNWNGELCRHDQIRNLRLMELGWDVMRFWVYQIRDDLDFCLDNVKKWIENSK